MKSTEYIALADSFVFRSGEGGDNRPADLVVQEIKSAGGVAVPNYDSVEGNSLI